LVGFVIWVTILSITDVKMDLLNVGFFKYNSCAIKKNDFGDRTYLGVTTLMETVGNIFVSFLILCTYFTCALASSFNTIPLSFKLMSLEYMKRSASSMSLSVKYLWCNVQCTF